MELFITYLKIFGIANFDTTNMCFGYLHCSFSRDERSKRLISTWAVPYMGLHISNPDYSDPISILINVGSMLEIEPSQQNAAFDKAFRFQSFRIVYSILLFNCRHILLSPLSMNSSNNSWPKLIILIITLQQVI